MISHAPVKSRGFFKAVLNKFHCLRSKMSHPFRYEYASLYLRTTVVGRWIYSCSVIIIVGSFKEGKWSSFLPSISLLIKEMYSLHLLLPKNLTFSGLENLRIWDCYTYDLAALIQISSNFIPGKKLSPARTTYCASVSFCRQILFFVCIMHCFHLKL